MSDLITNLEDLGPEELKAVSNLINKLAKRKKTEKTVDNKSELVDTVSDEKPKQKAVARQKEPQKQINRGRSEPRNKPKVEDFRRQGGKGRRGGGAGRTESVRLSNENKFEAMSDRNSFKQDVLIDKKLWGDRKPTERPDEFQFAEVSCKECGRWFDVNPNLVYVDQDTGEVIYTCDNCVPRGN